MGETHVREGRRWQFSLTGLIGGMVGVAVFAALVRGSRGYWEGREIDCDRVLGLATLAPVVGLGFFLVGSIIRRPPVRSRPAMVMAIGWRVVGLVALAFYAVAEARLLAMEGMTPWGWPGPEFPVFELRRKLLPICGLLGLAGLVLGLVPGRPRATATGGRSRFWWVSVVWAGLAALLIYALDVGYLPYLILIAIEGVSLAQRHPHVPAPGLWRRIAQATPAAIVAILACQVLALWVAHDMRRPRPDSDGAETAGSGWRWVPRLLSLVVTLGSAGYLVYVTIPLLHEHFAAGFRWALGMPTVLAIATGFAGLGAGLAARSAAPDEPRPPPDASRRSGTDLTWAWARQGLLILVLFLSGVAFLTSSLVPITPKNPGIGGQLIGSAHLIRSWTRDHLFDADVAWPFLAPDLLIWELLLAWIAFQLVRLAIRVTPEAAAPFDRVLASPSAFGGFLWIWVALTVVCLAALPTLVVAGVVATHDFVNAFDWFHWPA